MEQIKKRVYRDNWGFKIVATEEQFARRNRYIKNDGFRIADEYDYMDIGDYDLCLEVDEALFELKCELYDILADRVYLEYDINNDVILTFEEAIRQGWYNGGEWEDVVDIISRVKEGKYDDEMKRYYAYLQAESLLGNLDLLDFSDEDNIKESLSINNIFVYDDDLMFKLPGVIETVERTIDLEVDVKRLLAKVINSLKNTGKTIDFTVGY